MFRTIIFASISLLILNGCQNFFSTTLKVDPPEHVPQMAVHAYFNATDTVLYAAVSKTVGLLDDPNELAQLNDALVEVYQGSQKLFTMDLRQDLEYKFYNYSYTLDKAIEDYGETLEIRVSHKDFETATSTQTFPKAVVPQKFKFIENAGLNEYGDPTSGIEIDFNDIAGEDNYYEISVVNIDTFYSSGLVYKSYITSLDPLVSEGANYGTLLLDDQTFDGKNYKLNVLLEYRTSADLIFVNWKTLSEAQYLYSKSLQSFQAAQDAGPFGEPVSIYSNMENGLGVFALATSDFYEVEE